MKKSKNKGFSCRKCGKKVYSPYKNKCDKCGLILCKECLLTNNICFDCGLRLETDIINDTIKTAKEFLNNEKNIINQ